jgi:type VI secretion system protein ImpH
VQDIDNFFQTVRLLKLSGKKLDDIRFSVQPTLAFPNRSIVHADDSSMQITFMGLTGRMGVLPDHYTALIIQRLQQKDTALNDFFNLFNQRTISLFYEAWEKYRLYIDYERAQVHKNNTAHLDKILSGLIGDIRHVERPSEVTDKTLLYYAGLLAQQPRCAVNLENILTDYLSVPVRVKQFHGHWLTLPVISHPQLGNNALLGQRVWDVQSTFRLRIGPLDYSQFQKLLPIGDALLSLTQLTRYFAGHILKFDVQLILKANQIPECKLGKIYLGWNAWSAKALQKNNVYFFSESFLSAASLASEKSKRYFFEEPHQISFYSHFSEQVSDTVLQVNSL